jgi:hypothetical protein
MSGNASGRSGCSHPANRHDDDTETRLDQEGREHLGSRARPLQGQATWSQAVAEVVVFSTRGVGQPT